MPGFQRKGGLPAPRVLPLPLGGMFALPWRRGGLVAEAVVQLAAEIIQAASQTAHGIVNKRSARLARVRAVRGTVTPETGRDAARLSKQVCAAALVVAPDVWLVQG